MDSPTILRVARPTRLFNECALVATLWIGMVTLPAGAQTQVSAPAPLSVAAPTPSPNAPLLKPRPFTVQTDYGEGNAIANALRNSPPKLYTFDRASLADVLRFLADDAGIPFVSMQSRVQTDGGQGGNTTTPIDQVLVTFTMRASPFLVLESIAKANDVALVYENGVWFLRPYNEHELIGRIYRLKFTPQERVNFNTGPSASTQNNNNQNNQSGTLSTATIVVQQPVFIYQVQEPAIVAEIRNMLRIQAQGVNGKVAQGVASVENFPAMPANSGLNPAGSRIAAQTPPTIAEPSVTFNSDTNTIYVIANRQQHQWIEGFLAAADQPQNLIGIEVKFFETTRNPIKDLGINWYRTFGEDGGWGFNLNQSLEATGNVGFDVDNQSNRGIDRTNTQLGGGGSTSGTLPSSVNGSTPFNYNYNQNSINNITTDIYNSIRGYNAGMGAAYTAVLSPDDVGFTIEAFMQDTDTNLVQYPRVLTVNNREVAISNSRNIPVLLGSTENSSGGSSTQTNEVQYLPVGTQLNILPKTMPDGSVTLNVAITVSNQSGTMDLSLAPGQTNSYPITASRVYQAALQVDSGYTLAVGGLEEALDTTNDNGVLFLKDVPVVGQLFKSKGRNLNKRNLIIFITPSIIRDRSRTTGISDTPSTLPVRPGDPEPPSFGSDGRLVGGIEGLDGALSWIAFQNDLFQQINRESRGSRETIKQLEGVIRTAQMILAEIQVLAAKYPKQAGILAGKEEQANSLIAKLNDTLRQTRKNLF